MSELISMVQGEDEDDRYEAFLAGIRQRCSAVSSKAVALFVTDATGLFDAFLAALPEHRRRHYTCNACRRFMDRFGGLVAINEDGSTHPLFWSYLEAPRFFHAAVKAVARLVAQARVVGVHVSDETTWGTPSNKSKKTPFEWHHMAVEPPPSLVYTPTALKNAGQRAAELTQDYQTLTRGLGEFPIDVARQAHTLLTSGNLYRSEKCIGVAKWLLDLHEQRARAMSSTHRQNITWLFIATAPIGFCHVRSSMIGTLLEDIAASMSFEAIKERFDSKMHPLQYQRPQVPPAAGNVAHAEKIVAELRSAGALNRRFAKLEDVQTIWKPTPAPERAPAGGVFGHLRTKGVADAASHSIEQPAVTMTWEKFARTVLPEAAKIEAVISYSNMNFAAMVTATDPTAPPLLQWDREDKRNTVSWYLYHGGSPASRWGLQAGAYCRVTGIALQPSMWDAERAQEHQGKAVFFLLHGAKDLGYESGGAFFPETLRAEYRSVRATMEAYAKNAVIEGKDDASACGIKLEGGAKDNWNVTVRVTDKNGQRLSYALDRWD